jgi:hypothetical protein
MTRGDYLKRGRRADFIGATTEWGEGKDSFRPREDTSDSAKSQADYCWAGLGSIS